MYVFCVMWVVSGDCLKTIDASLTRYQYSITNAVQGGSKQTLKWKDLPGG